MPNKPLFITGIGTGIGKTIVSAILVEKLKADIRTLLEKHKIGLIIFNTSKGDRLQKALIAHQMDSVLFSIPSLLINEELK